MDSKELLQAIGQMMEATKDELRQDMRKLEDKLEEKLESTTRRLEEKINGVDMRVARDFQEIKGLLKDDYGRVAKNAAKGAVTADRLKETESTVATLEHVAKNHNERITALEEKAV